uniref:hypothetical protein n=1 Tax=Terasakiella sp. TaxID=2034861 RepID=UPI003AA970B8
MIEPKIRNIPKLMVLGIEQSLKHQTQFRVICIGSTYILIQPFIMWYLPLALTWLATAPALYIMEEPYPLTAFPVLIITMIGNWAAYGGTLLAACMAIVYAIWLMVVSVIGYQKRANSLKAIIQMFIEAILAFAVL